MATICPCNCKYHRAVDLRTPRTLQLTAFYKRSNAFHTVREKLPVVVKRVMEYLQKSRDTLASEYGEEAREELKSVVDELAVLKYEMQTNQEFIPIKSDATDALIYNEYLKTRDAVDGHATAYNTLLLFAESYLYRRIRVAFEHKKKLCEYDPFQSIKQAAYEDSGAVILELSIHLDEGCECISDKDAFIDLLKISLWANRYDLATNGAMCKNAHITDALRLEPNVICDMSEQVFDCLRDAPDTDAVDFVLANAGFELFVDLCLADLMVEKSFTEHVTFHVKTFPFYVSDVTIADVNWMINQVKNHQTASVKQLGERWADYMSKKVWEIMEHEFWTYPLDYSFMEALAPDLYERLTKANIIIFKGDLNYRRLFGDINWDPITSIEQGLRGFLPTRLCTIRVVKNNVICGLSQEMLDKCDSVDIDWAESGKYAVVQFCDSAFVEPESPELVYPPDPGAEEPPPDVPPAEGEEGVPPEAPPEDVEGVPPEATPEAPPEAPTEAPTEAPPEAPPAEAEGVPPEAPADG